jgi:hypothetical protein
LPRANWARDEDEEWDAESEKPGIEDGCESLEVEDLLNVGGEGERELEDVEPEEDVCC